MINYRDFLKISDLAKEADGGRGVRVAVLDTGIPVVDGVPVSIAENFTNEDSHDTGHATFVGSILFGRGEVAGICPNATSYFGKVFKMSSATPEAIAEAINYASGMWNADIINLSLGFASNLECNKALKAACEFAILRGTAIVASSGNDGGKTMWPAALQGVISVGASNGKTREEFSNKGKIDVVAPGSNLEGLNIDGNIIERSGTSFSTAIITGLLALLLAKKRKTAPSAKARDVKKDLIDMCVDIGSWGFDKETGFGFPFKDIIPRSFNTSIIGLSLRSLFVIIENTVKKALFALKPRRQKSYE